MKDRTLKVPDLGIVLLIFSTRAQKAIRAMFSPHHARYISSVCICMNTSFLSVLLIRKLDLFCFPFKYKTSLSANVLLGGNVVLINKNVLLFSQ